MARSAIQVQTNLLVEPLDPTVQVLQLVLVQVHTVVQRSVEIDGQHLLVKTLTGKSPCGISPGEVLVWTAWAIEVPSRRHIVDLASDCEVNRPATFAVIFKQRARSVGLEDDWRWTFGKVNGRSGAETIIGEYDKEGEEDEIDGGRNSGAAWVNQQQGLNDESGRLITPVLG